MERLGEEIREAARNLRENNYKKTSDLIISLTENLGGQNDSSKRTVFVRQIGSLFEVFNNEFAISCPIGQSYRRRCFEETAMIVLKVLGQASDKNSEDTAKVNDFLDHLHGVKKNIEPVMGHFMGLYSKPNRSEQESLVMFHAACESYLVTVEGVFDELAKTLYRLIEAPQNDKSEDLQNANVWSILRSCKNILGISPIFLENWVEKNDIRNAIAHAQAEYNPKENRAHFSSTDRVSKRIYDRTMSFEEFLAIQLELIDAIDSFYYAVELFRIMQLLALLYASNSGETSL